MVFQVVGRDPPASLRRLSGQNGVEVVGTVPDVRPYLEEAAVVVVPILVGGGTRLKIYEAMAMGKAVVSTTIGAEGLVYTPGEHLLVADEPAAFAEAVVSLLEASQLRSRLGQSALRLVNDCFSAETVARQFESILSSVLESLSVYPMTHPSTGARMVSSPPITTGFSPHAPIHFDLFRPDRPSVLDRPR